MAEALFPTIRKLPANDGIRQRALERLYVRREAVDQLIRSLEVYEQLGHNRRAPSIQSARRASLGELVLDRKLY